MAQEHGSLPPPEVEDLFTNNLAQLIRAALAPQGGDPAFQALVMCTHDAHVDEYVRLAAQAPADRRAVRAATDAIAHPGKLRGMAAGEVREALASLHHLTAVGAWTELEQAAARLLAQTLHEHEPLRGALRAILVNPSLARLQRGGALAHVDSVRQYEALCSQRGPLAGSDAAAAQGRTSARLGAAAEDVAVQALRTVAELLTDCGSSCARYRVVRSLRTPRGFPGAAEKAKDEWDVAIVQSTPAGGAADIALLAEVKASPAAATPDFSRLQRGLQRLGQAGAHEHYTFASADGQVRLSGGSLRSLLPQGFVLPTHVIYCCSAPVETHPQVLSAASKAALLAEPASLALGRRLAAGGSPCHQDLALVWEALMAAPRLRSALHQYATAQAAREIMLHPHDLVAAVEQRLEGTRAAPRSKPRS